jgi:hypothetical protein
MTHVKTSAAYPQSNGKMERWYQSLKRECIRPRTPVSLSDARSMVKQYVDYYNEARLHSSIGFLTSQDKLAGREEVIFAERDRKLNKARESIINKQTGQVTRIGAGFGSVKIAGLGAIR